jgi:hypothetical protein
MAQAGRSIVFGNASASTLDAAQNYVISYTKMSEDPMHAAPIQLTAAGDASGLDTGMEDLVGISEDAGGNAELDLFTNGSTRTSETDGGYACCHVSEGQRASLRGQ